MRLVYRKKKHKQLGSDVVSDKPVYKMSNSSLYFMTNYDFEIKSSYDSKAVHLDASSGETVALPGRTAHLTMNPASVAAFNSKAYFVVGT